ncbi:hypothetical protein [Lactococcus termiticola]|uniref:Uncharacterized protein n=1 Tax=Lactococcus termiticola TaxID=2169526 RepID=A0A2R5HDT3_9LACT|nr:hypothetical protein [Lactococcus termiticola]GBG96227.1 hypothetical protein NtB2_00338 [Lactococcus termiticola]
MIGVLLAIISGIAAIWNFGNLHSSLLAIVTLIIAIAGVVLYQGRRSRRNYSNHVTRIFTLPFAICILSLVGNVAVAAAVIFHLT